MRLRATGTLISLLTLAFVLVSLRAFAQQQKYWTWEDRYGHVRTRADLDKILARQMAWVATNEKLGAPDDLQGANLRGANLARADLEYANLAGADLSGANLQGISIQGVDLRGATLDNANLSGADMNNADLSGATALAAHMRHANLETALLDGANLSYSDLVAADLTGADLQGTLLPHADLSGAELYGANLAGASFEPKDFPSLEGIAYARGLELLRYDTNPGPLTRLRKRFRDAGFGDAERGITCALKREEVRRDGFVERWFNRIAFDWTCEYGLRPGRALLIGLALLLLFGCIYSGFIHWGRQSGIYFVGSRTSRGKFNTQAVRIRPRAIHSQKWWKIPLLWLKREGRVVYAAMFFSLMSAFNIGFRDINFGRWLRMLTKREYDLKPVGWARTVSGVQSLLSVYLIALWVLTYFGRPFG